MPIYTVIFAYILLVYFLPRMIIPYLGFKKSPIPNKLPRNLEHVIDELSKKHKSKEDFLKASYEYITSIYQGSRAKTVTRFWYMFKDPFNFKEKPDFMPCNLQNHLLRAMLIKSGRFEDNDIKIRTVPFNLIIHQFLEVKVNNKWVNIDPWAKSLGIEYGKRVKLFG